MLWYYQQNATNTKLRKFQNKKPNFSALKLRDWTFFVTPEKRPLMKILQNCWTSNRYIKYHQPYVPSMSNFYFYMDLFSFVFVNINLSQSDHFKSEPLHSELFPYLIEKWEFRVSCPEGGARYPKLLARQPTGRPLPFVSYFV